MRRPRPSRTEMYHAYFDLERSPFSIAPDPRFLYMSERHREALAHLLWGLKSDGGFVLLTGEVGTGKTTLSRCLLEQIEDDTDLAFIINPKVTANEMLATICDELGIPVPQHEQHSARRLVDRINHRLLAAHAQGRRTVLVIDEAQNLATSVLEQIRLLTNLETSERKLLQVILIGQPELAELLRKPELRQLAQRITARYHLAPLGADELAALVQHRMNVAGARRNPFAPRALRILHRRSGGIPRLANVIADRALLGAFAEGSERVTAAIVNRAAGEVLGETDRGARWLRPMLAGAAVLVVVAALLILVPDRMLSERLPSVADDTAPVPPDSDPATGVSATGVPATGLPATGVPATGMPATGVPATSMSAAEATPAAAAADSGREDTTRSGPDESSGAPPAEATAPIPFGRADTDRSAAPPPGPLDSEAVRRVGALPISDSIDSIASLTAAEARVAAAAAVLGAWRTPVPLTAASDLCAAIGAVGLGCLRWSDDWAGLLRMDRPALLTVSSGRGGQERHVALLGLQPGTATVGLGEQRFELPLDELRDHWLGRATLFWQLPPAYREPTRLGDSSAAVDWLHDRLETLAGRTPRARTTAPFDAALEARVLGFQAREGLNVDGVAGPETWMRINALTDVGVPSLRSGALR